MNKYKSLAQNTAIFALGTFASKILSFIMVFFYSRAMETGEFGMLDIIINSASLLLPVAMLGITNGIIRFGLEPQNDKRDVFTTGLISVGIGFGILLLFAPLILRLQDLKNYIFLFYAHILTSSLRHICSYFVRADKRMKLFAVDGVFSTFMTGLLTIIFLLPLNMGIKGYMLAIILADLSSVIFLGFNAKLYRRVKFRGINTHLAKKMISFSVPLIPTSIMWWIVNVSDRYFVKYMVSAEANGLYSAAYKIPTVLTLVATVFLDAWQISAVVENESRERNRFYSVVFKAFQGAIFVVSSGLILFSKVITRVLLHSSYYESWRHIPVLVFATVFSCFVTFLGNIYLAEKKKIATLITTAFGAVLNLVLNFLLIPYFGASGAAIATCISYFLVFFVRAVDIKHRNPDIQFCSVRIAVNSGITILQIFIMLSEPKHWIIYSIACLVFISIYNYKLLLGVVRKLLKKEN